MKRAGPSGPPSHPDDDAGRLARYVGITNDVSMEAGTLETVFQPFEQADPSIAQQFGGLGLGLAIAKASVDAHGGTIRAASLGRGRGATITVDLPVGPSSGDG